MGVREWVIRASPHRRAALVLGVILAAAVAGCGAPHRDPGETADDEEANDPFESVNREIFAVNLAIDRDAVRPAAQTYRDVPEVLRDGVHNFLVTLGSPVVFANELLQGELDKAGDTLTRLVINLTAGAGGFFDVARDRGGVERHEADFGQTLGVWGVGEGPYLMLPVFGPSNPRDAVGRAADGFMDPLHYFTGFIGEGIARGASSAVDQRERNLEAIDTLERTTLDYYATVRSVYRQRRNNMIRHGSPGTTVPEPGIPFQESAKDRSGMDLSAQHGPGSVQAALTPSAAQRNVSAPAAGRTLISSGEQPTACASEGLGMRLVPGEQSWCATTCPCSASPRQW